MFCFVLLLAVAVTCESCFRGGACSLRRDTSTSASTMHRLPCHPNGSLFGLNGSVTARPWRGGVDTKKQPPVRATSSLCLTDSGSRWRKARATYDCVIMPQRGACACTSVDFLELLPNNFCVVFLCCTLNHLTPFNYYQLDLAVDPFSFTNHSQAHSRHHGPSW
jgi:hypothetical protein